MPQMVPRLHSEFFDLLQRAESVLEHKAKVGRGTARLIVEAAVSAYVDEGRSPFNAYLLAELRNRPAIYEAIPGEALDELFEGSDATASRRDWLLKSSGADTKHLPISFRDLVGRIQE